MTEHRRYTVTDRMNGFEVRRYEPAVFAEVQASGGFGSAINSAFRTLVSYIGGRNSGAEKIAMTAPVMQQQTGDANVIAFVMPSGSTLEEMPQPADPSIRLRAVDEELVAAQRFSGRWSQSEFERRADDLVRSATEAGFEPMGPVQYARYDPPWTPWFMRRNEVLVRLG